MTEKMKPQKIVKNSPVEELLQHLNNSSVQHVNCGQGLNQWMNDSFEKYEK